MPIDKSHELYFLPQQHRDTANLNCNTCSRLPKKKGSLPLLKFSCLTGAVAVKEKHVATTYSRISAYAGYLAHSEGCRSGVNGVQGKLGLYRRVKRHLRSAVQSINPE